MMGMHACIIIIMHAIQRVASSFERADDDDDDDADDDDADDDADRHSQTQRFLPRRISACFAAVLPHVSLMVHLHAGYGTLTLSLRQPPDLHFHYRRCCLYHFPSGR
jgi:hypothetical protein